MGVFITFEGQEGAGKSTMAKLLYEYLIKKDFAQENIILTREPGGTCVSEEIRSIVQNNAFKNLAPKAEALLFLASRAQLVSEVIKPALDLGKIVICDRFIDSTIAYQGFGNGINLGDLEFLNAFSAENLIPDITFLLRIDPKIGLQRKKTDGVLDRIESKELKYHENIHKGYIWAQNAYKERIIAIDSSDSEAKVWSIIEKNIDNLFNKEEQ